MVKRVGKYEIGKTLGEGTFGKVKYAVNTETGQRVAIKILDKEKIQKQNMGAQIKKEISIMKMVKQKHVVKLYEVLASRTKIFIVLELITGGELFDKIVAEGRFSEQTARFYFRQLINGVRYCHEQGVAHRDLKPENLLLDEQGNLKISDFGLSALYTGGGDDSRTTLLHTTCGTPNYVAPEVLNDKGYDGRAADVWSCGVILYVLLAGFLPFDEPHMSALFRKIQKAEFNYPSWFSAPIRDLIDRILVADPTKRVTVADIMADPWFRGDTDSDAGSVVTKGSSEAAGPGLVPAPSAHDIENAVSEDVTVVQGTPAAAEEEAALNAFDVCNMLGGIALNRLLLTSVGDKRNLSPQFLSEASTATIISRSIAELTKLGAEATGDEKANKVKARIQTPRGEISMSVYVYSMSEELRLVEVRRGRGDLLEYNSLYKKFCDGLIDIMIASRSGGGGGGH